MPWEAIGGAAVARRRELGRWGTPHGLGALLAVVGVAMLVLPGPGMLFLAAGVALMLSQWPRGQRTLARLRLRLRERYGSPRVQQVEAHLPDEVCPPIETTELRAVAEAPIEPRRTPEPT